MKILPFFFTFFLFFLSAQEECVDIHSGEALLQGNELILLDQVDVEHPIGKVSAERFSIQAAPDFKSYKAVISGGVSIAFNGQGKVSCERVELDYKLLKGVFQGTTAQERVVYSRAEEWTLESNKMGVILKKLEPALKFGLDSFEACGECQFNTSSHFPLCLQIHAQHVDWKEKEGELQLEEGVKIVFEKKLHFRGAHKVLLKRGSEESGPTLGNLKAEGELEFEEVDDQNNVLRSILHIQSLMIDNDSRLIFLESSSNQQILIKDSLGHLRADQVKIHYTHQEGKIEILQIVLEGHIKIEKFCEKTEDITQSIVADLVEFFPQQNTMLLYGKNDREVLLEDALNKIRLSAPGLKISYDPLINKEVITGLGLVRFLFIEQEFQMMKQSFESPLSSLKKV